MRTAQHPDDLLQSLRKVTSGDEDMDVDAFFETFNALDRCLSEPGAPLPVDWDPALKESPENQA